MTLGKWKHLFNRVAPRLVISTLIWIWFLLCFRLIILLVKLKMSVCSFWNCCVFLIISTLWDFLDAAKGKMKNGERKSSRSCFSVLLTWRVTSCRSSWRSSCTYVWSCRGTKLSTSNFVCLERSWDTARMRTCCRATPWIASIRSPEEHGVAKVCSAINFLWSRNHAAADH